MTWFKRLLLAAASAASLWPIRHFLEWIDKVIPSADGDIISYVFIGGIFGALVLVPFVTSHSYRVGRIVGLVICSVLIYALAVELALDGYGPLDLGGSSIILSGVIGALLVGFVTRLVAPLKISWEFWLFVPFAGLFGGFIFNIMFNIMWIDNLSEVAAYAAWQIPVCLAIHGGCANDT